MKWITLIFLSLNTYAQTCCPQPPPGYPCFEEGLATSEFSNTVPTAEVLESYSHHEPAHPPSLIADINKLVVVADRGESVYRPPLD